MSRERDPRVPHEYKDACAARGDDCCEICRWRPPRALRDVAGGRIDRLLQAHHIVPVACGGSDAHENLILLCPNHHAIAHHMGRMGPARPDQPREWHGPHSRRDLQFAMVMLSKREEYARFVEVDLSRAIYLRVLEEEALEQDAVEMIRIHRRFTVVRGRPLPERRYLRA